VFILFMEEINSILLVDDNKTTLQLNKWLLKDYYPEDKIHLRTSGKEALEFIRQYQDQVNTHQASYPLLVICDVYMPDFTGWEIVEFLERNEEIERDQIFIVLLSAYVHAKDAEISCKNENVVCMNKPLTEENVEM